MSVLIEFIQGLQKEDVILITYHLVLSKPSEHDPLLEKHYETPIKFNKGMTFLCSLYITVLSKMKISPLNSF